VERHRVVITLRLALDEHGAVARDHLESYGIEELSIDQPAILEAAEVMVCRLHAADRHKSH